MHRCVVMPDRLPGVLCAASVCYTTRKRRVTLEFVSLEVQELMLLNSRHAVQFIVGKLGRAVSGFDVRKPNH